MNIGAMYPRLLLQNITQAKKGAARGCVLDAKAKALALDEIGGVDVSKMFLRPRKPAG